jgi:putative PIN family toxin of toxin-antitoxin system
MPPVSLRHGQGLGEEAGLKLVLDTNIVLDLFVFGDPAVKALHELLAARSVQWFATRAMREELACVLDYAHLRVRMQGAGITSAHVLDAFDAHAQVVDVAAPARVVCRDTDDQKFIDLAVAQGATLLSKDKHVLALRRKLAALEVAVAKVL